MKGMIFKPESIQAIIEGRKTQTRRVIKPQPKYLEGDKYSQWFWCKKNVSEIEALQLNISHVVWWDKVKNPILMLPFARHQVGETVYIKEAWAIEYEAEFCPKLEDEVTVKYLDGSRRTRYKNICDNPAGKTMYSVIQAEVGEWKSARIMPEIVARYFTTITDVRAERVQEIRYLDIFLEGVPEQGGFIKNFKAFEKLWNSINKDYPWESNPWVFAYTFRLKGEK